MGNRNTLEAQLVNYDLTRKVFAVRTMNTLNKLIDEEADEDDPDLIAIAALSSAMASILSSVT